MEGCGIDQSRVEFLFVVALERLEALQRELSPWEAQCLLLALKSIATANWAAAEQHIQSCSGPSPARLREPPIFVTIAGLRSGLAVVRRLREMQRQHLEHC